MSNPNPNPNKRKEKKYVFTQQSILSHLVKAML